MSGQIRAIRDFAPIRKTVFVETSDPHQTGFAVFEFSPSGIRWWWEYDEQGAQQVSWAQIVAGTHCVHADDVTSQLDRAGQAILAAEAKLAVIRRSSAWKLIP